MSCAVSGSVSAASIAPTRRRTSGWSSPSAIQATISCPSSPHAQAGHPPAPTSSRAKRPTATLRTPGERLANERVGAPLRADDRARPMPAQERRLVPERKQLVPDRSQQRFRVAVWEIGAADRTLEQHIAHYGQA